MEKTLNIDGQEVRFKASGATPRVYRALFKSDIFADIQKLMDDMGKGGLSNASLEVFENIAFTMAKQADPTLTDPDTFLDGFGVFSIYQILPQLMNLWGENLAEIEAPKKNIGERNEN